MRFTLLIALPIVLHAQPPAIISLKHDPITIEGTVVDEEGKPVRGARVDHAKDDSYPAGPETDWQGRFTVEAQGPAVVIRKVGYESYFLRLRGSPVRVTMKTLQPWPDCVSSADIFPGVKFVTRSGIDYVVRERILETEDGPKSISDGQGPLWSFGFPLTVKVWSSTEYIEHVEGTKEHPDFIQVIDARGKTKDGKYWRSRATLGKSTSYDGVDEHTAALMDRLIGGRCPTF